jgi:hypothetical protein
MSIDMEELEKYINFFKQQYRPEEIRLEWLNGKAPCGKCHYQLSCNLESCSYKSTSCNIFQKWRKIYHGD